MPDISPDPPATSPLTAYHQVVEQCGFAPDEAQRRVAEALERCFQALHEPHCHGAIQGVYLWGPVGHDRTWLTGHFYQCLRVPVQCQHFHYFMQWVHQRQLELIGTVNPLRALARELVRDVRALCFDELFISDIGDVTLFGSLLRIMFEEGVVLVVTFNQPPEQLYADGFNRERFLPAIEAIQWHMAVVAVDGGEDHRLHPGRAEQRYWVVEAGQAGGFVELLARLSVDEVVSAQPTELGYRPLAVRRHSELVLWCSYVQLCGVPLLALDFIGPCDRYRAVLMDDPPCLSASQREGRIARGTEDDAQLVEAGDRELSQLSVHNDDVRRFIALVDECYDHKVPPYLEVGVPLEVLCTEGYLAFASRHTLSQLREMQLARFGSNSAGQRRAAEAGTADGRPRSSAGQAEAQ